MDLMCEPNKQRELFPIGAEYSSIWDEIGAIRKLGMWDLPEDFERLRARYIAVASKHFGGDIFEIHERQKQEAKKRRNERRKELRRLKASSQKRNKRGTK
jgi:hypothetical protein